MATRSAIGILHSDETVIGIYCHYDGYPSHVGKVLFEHYGEDKLKELLSLGNLSSIGPEIGVSNDFEFRDQNFCTFYGRDRQDQNAQAKVFSSIREFMSHYNWSDYYYLYDMRLGTWLYAPSGRPFRELGPDLDQS